MKKKAPVHKKVEKKAEPVKVKQESKPAPEPEPAKPVEPQPSPATQLPVQEPPPVGQPHVVVGY